MMSFRDRVLKEQDGFTLPEMLVTMMIMIIVLFALYSIFDMSLRVFSFGNDKIEAVQNARLGLERMEREIRAAYPCDASDDVTTNDHLFLNPTDTICPTTPAMPTSAQITFANDLSSTTDPGYRKVDFPGEVISYYQSGDELIRSQGGTAQSVVAPLEVDANGLPDGLQFSYLDSSGNTYTGSDPNQVHAVRISLTISVDRGVGGPATQILTTDVDLRNRG